MSQFTEPFEETSLISLPSFPYSRVFVFLWEYKNNWDENNF
jgi:hypothetical protein